MWIRHCRENTTVHLTILTTQCHWKLVDTGKVHCRLSSCRVWKISQRQQPNEDWSYMLSHLLFFVQVKKVFKTNEENSPPFLARRILPRRCASCLLEPPWAEIWISTLASGRSKDVSATCWWGTEQTPGWSASQYVCFKHISVKDYVPSHHVIWCGHCLIVVWNYEKNKQQQKNDWCANTLAFSKYVLHVGTQITHLNNMYSCSPEGKAIHKDSVAYKAQH